MEQQIISKAELVKIINDELSKHEECNDCSISGIMKLQETDDVGCNWTDPYIQCSGVPADVCAPIAGQVFSAMKKIYNIE